MPDLIRHPVPTWIPAFAGMTILRYLIAGVIIAGFMGKKYKTFEIYLVYIDADRCDGCEECVKMCPVDVFDMTHKAYPTRPQNCLGCGTCAALCKSKAIIITEI